MFSALTLRLTATLMCGIVNHSFVWNERGGIITESTREKIFEFVRGRILAGEPPTVREVQEHFGFKSVASAREQLDTLIDEGRLARLGNVSRGFRLSAGQGPHLIRQIPVVGRVQAGALTLAVEDIEECIPLDAPGTEDGVFALRVRGDSMHDAGILEGDYVIVCPAKDARNGEIVVALVRDEATVKRLFKCGAVIELRPENSDYPPILVPARQVELVGRMIEVRRYL